MSEEDYMEVRRAAPYREIGGELKVEGWME